MDGENNGTPYEKMDDLGGFPIFLVQHPYPIINGLNIIEAGRDFPDFLEVVDS